MKNTLEGMNNRLSDTKECTSDLEDRMMEITRTKQQKEKQILKNGNSLRDVRYHQAYQHSHNRGPRRRIEKDGSPKHIL